MSAIARFLFLILLSSAAVSQEVVVPDELEGWQDWVLHDKEYRQCPFYFDRRASADTDFACRWPGTLALDVTDRGARFSQRWTMVGKRGWLPLPGDATHWPDQVTVDGAAALVIERNGVPGILVDPGEYRVDGRFAWDERGEPVV